MSSFPLVSKSQNPVSGLAIQITTYVQSADRRHSTRPRLKMKTDGKYFLDRLANFPPNTFERSFSNVALKLGLGSLLSHKELNLLFEAAFFAALCNLAFNGLGGCGGEIKPEREGHRMRLEWSFMAARDRFFDSLGWKVLPLGRRTSIKRVFLTVSVAEANLAQ